MSILQSTQTKATTKRLRQQPAVRRERLVAAAEGCVCAVCVFFQIRSKLNQSLPFLSPRKTNTIIREERADKKSPCSL